MAVQVACCTTLGPPLPLSPWMDGMCICRCAAVEHAAQGASAPSARQDSKGGGSLCILLQAWVSVTHVGLMVNAQIIGQISGAGRRCVGMWAEEALLSACGAGTPGAPLFLCPGGSWSMKGQESQ